MFMLKELAILVAGIFIGFTFATMMLYPQIQNRYTMGQNNGYLSGAFKVINFLKTNFSDNSKQPLTDDHPFLNIKDATIEVFEKDGVRTLRVR